MITLPLTWIPFLNIVLAVLILWALWRGYQRGFILSLVELLGMIVSLWLSFLIAPEVSKRLPIFNQLDISVQFEFLSDLILQNVNTVLWFFILFVMFSISLFLFKPMLKGLNKIPILGWVNQLLGALFGLLKTLLILWLVSILLSTPLFVNGKSYVDNSALTVFSDINLDLAVDLPIDAEIVGKLIRQESLTDAEDEAIQAWIQNLVNQENFKETFQKWLDEGLINENNIQGFMTWLQQFDNLDALQAWLESLKP